MSLEGTWPVYRDEQTVGRCEAVRQGLYLQFDCRCGPSVGKILRLVLRTPEDDFSLGIPVPEGGELQLHTKVAAKKLPQSGPIRLELLESMPARPKQLHGAGTGGEEQQWTKPSKPEPPMEPELPPQPEPPMEPELPPQPEPPMEPELPLQPEPPMEPELPPQPELPMEPELPPQPEPPMEPELPPQPEPPMKPQPTPRSSPMVQETEDGTAAAPRLEGETGFRYQPDQPIPEMSKALDFYAENQGGDTYLRIFKEKN